MCSSICVFFPPPSRGPPKFPESGQQLTLVSKQRQIYSARRGGGLAVLPLGSWRTICEEFAGGGGDRPLRVLRGPLWIRGLRYLGRRSRVRSQSRVFAVCEAA